MNPPVFTGIVTATGRVRSAERTSSGARLVLECSIGALELGESVSVNGVCLTVLEPSARGFSADLSVETLDRTTLGQLGAGASVNLERSLRVEDRLGGHWVTGHVDGVARVSAVENIGAALLVELACAPALVRYIAVKGSVALDGVSLTVNSVSNEGFSVMLIPHTLAVTTFAVMRRGTILNLEVDMLMRYVARWLETSSPAPAASS